MSIFVVARDEVVTSRGEPPRQYSGWLRVSEGERLGKRTRERVAKRDRAKLGQVYLIISVKRKKMFAESTNHPDRRQVRRSMNNPAQSCWQPVAPFADRNCVSTLN